MCLLILHKKYGKTLFGFTDLALSGTSLKVFHVEFNFSSRQSIDAMLPHL